MSEQDAMTKSQAIQAVLDRLDGPITLDEFIQQVLVLSPSQAKDPGATIRNELRYDSARNVVFIDKKTLLPVRLVMNGLRFRITLTRQEVEHGVIGIFPWFVPFMVTNPFRSDPGEFHPHFYDEQDKEIPYQPAKLRQRIEGFWGPETTQVPAFNLSRWLALHDARRGDSLLVTIKGWAQQDYVLIFEPAKRMDRAKVRQQNAALADAIYEVLRAHRDDRPFSSEVIPYAYARLGDAAHDYPGDHWVKVVEDDKRLGHTGYIFVSLARYASLGEEPLLQEAEPENLSRVFRFKVSFKYDRSIWRRIELRGSDTLRDFDGLMRGAFNHDTSDHLSEFSYKPKDRGRRARWEGYGYHNPYEGGEADDIQIAQLGLSVGDELQYVYDFGDNIQHIVSLEAVAGAEPGVEYPRITGQNKPRYQNCGPCAARGEEKTATWICIECSNEQQREVLICEECLMKEHEGHYAEEIVY